MIPIVNLNNMVEKRLETEHPSLQRTRRWMADANQNVYESWYPAKTSQISGLGNSLDNVSRPVQAKPSWEVPSSILTRIANLFNTRRQAARSEG
jgi:hypothetical protein